MRRSILLLASALTWLATWLAWAREARADLMEDVESLQRSYRASGAAVEHLPSQFLISGESRRLAIKDGRDEKRRCMTVVAIAERVVGFEIRAALPPSLGVHNEPTRSEAGYATLVDCGRGALGVGSIELIMGSRRGAVELLVVVHPKGLPSVEVVLPERALGPVTPDDDVARSLRLAPLEDRILRAEVAATADGAERVVRVPTQSDERGVNAMALRLREGCHRISVLAEQVSNTSGVSAVDVDAEVRHPGSETALREDRSHAPDARLDFCIGETARVDLRFAGAGGRVSVMVLDAHWPLPTGIPEGWGPRARAGHAWALHRRHAPRVSEAPMLSIVGVPGVTDLVLEMQPGACYLASLAVTEGDAQAGQLSMLLGAESRHDDMSEAPRAAAVTICAGPQDRIATLRADVRAQAAWWLLHVWQLTVPSFSPPVGPAFSPPVGPGGDG